MNTLFYFILFTVSLVGSPGPVNILLAGLGANHGIVRNMPFVAGLIVSATVVSVACLAGFQIVFQNPIVHNWIVVFGSLYIMYLAAKLYRMRPQGTDAPPVMHRFHDGLLVTLLNPKFYVMVTAVFSQFIGPGENDALFVVGGFIGLLFVAHVVWLGLGATLKGILQSTQHFHIINKCMGALLFVFAVYFLVAQLTR